MPQLVGMQLSTIDSVLTSCVENHLNNEDLTITDLNMLVRTLSNRKSKFLHIKPKFFYRKKKHLQA